MEIFKHLQSIPPVRWLAHHTREAIGTIVGGAILTGAMAVLTAAVGLLGSQPFVVLIPAVLWAAAGTLALYKQWKTLRTNRAATPLVTGEQVEASSQTVIAAPPQEAPESDEERQAKHDLGVFVATRFLPAYRVQMELHAAILQLLIKPSVINQLVWDGLYSQENIRIYRDAHDFLEKAVRTNLSGVSLAALMKKVWTVSRYYHACSLFSWLCHETDIDYKNDERLARIYAEWRRLSDDLESDYRRFVRDSRFSSLYKVDASRRVGEDFATDL